MRNKFFLFSLMLLFSLFYQGSHVSANPASFNAGPVDPYIKFSTLSIKQVQALTGRKLTLKEKIGVKLFQSRLKKGWRPGKEGEKSNTGTIALVLSILGLLSLFVMFSIGILPAAIFTGLGLIFGYKAKRQNPDDKKAKWAIILGWSAIALFLVYVLFVILLFSGGWSFG